MQGLRQDEKDMSAAVEKAASMFDEYVNGIQVVDRQPASKGGGFQRDKWCRAIV